MKTKLRNALCILFSVLLVAALFCGCGAKSASADTAIRATGSMTAMNSSAKTDYAMEMPAMEADYAYDSGYYAEPEAYYDDYSYASQTGGAMLSGGKNAAAPAETFDKIIYSGNARIESVEFDAVLEDIYALIDSVGGFLESSYVTGKDYYTSYYGGTAYRNASFTVRIPRDAFRSFTGALESLGNLTYTSYQAQNITSSYFDTESRLETYRTEEKRLLEMLNKAENVEDMLNIEDRLASVRYNIESLTSTLTNWDSKINYSTLYLEVQEVKELTKETPITRTFGEDLVQGVKDSCAWLVRALKDSAIFLVSAIPVLIIPAIVAVVVILAIRSAKRKKRAKISETKAEISVTNVEDDR